METLIENSPAPSVEVPRLVRLRCWLRNLKHWKTGRAIRDLERAFWSDDGFVLTWKCQIAMTLIDRCGLPHDKANECADELMRALFGCKPNKDKTDQQPQVATSAVVCADALPDPEDVEAYSAWIDSMANQCTCEGVDRPCDGLLAGGLCDDMHLCSADFAADLDSHTDKDHSPIGAVSASKPESNSAAPIG